RAPTRAALAPPLRLGEGAGGRGFVPKSSFSVYQGQQPLHLRVRPGHVDRAERGTGHADVEVVFPVHRRTEEGPHGTRGDDPGNGSLETKHERSPRLDRARDEGPPRALA